jgi:plastocyanin
MKRNIYITLFTVLLLSSLFAAVSCGTASPTVTLTTTQPTTVAPGASAAVAIDNFAFSPATLTVTAGTIVTWTNKDSAAHNIISQTKVFQSDTMSTGGTFSFTFKDKGTYDYHCGIHPSMTGKVIVE